MQALINDNYVFYNQHSIRTVKADIFLFYLSFFLFILIYI